MTKSRSKLYLFLISVCTAGYLWLVVNRHSGFDNAEHIPFGCLIKQSTGLACPSCGSTHSVLSLLQGDIRGALWWNPLGLVSALIMFLLPFWILYDTLRRKETLFRFYQAAE